MGESRCGKWWTSRKKETVFRYTVWHVFLLFLLFHFLVFVSRAYYCNFFRCSVYSWIVMSRVGTSATKSRTRFYSYADSDLNFWISDVQIMRRMIWFFCFSSSLVSANEQGALAYSSAKSLPHRVSTSAVLSVSLFIIMRKIDESVSYIDSIILLSVRWICCWIFISFVLCLQWRTNKNWCTAGAATQTVTGWTDAHISSCTGGRCNLFLYHPSVTLICGHMCLVTSKAVTWILSFGSLRLRIPTSVI